MNQSESYTTTYYPDINIYSTASMPHWRQISHCVVSEDGVRFVLVEFKFHPRKKTIELNKRRLKSIKKVGMLRVTYVV